MDKEPREDLELISLREAARLLRMSCDRLRKRAEDYGAIRVGNEFKFFKAIVGSTVLQIIGLLRDRLVEEWRQYKEAKAQAPAPISHRCRGITAKGVQCCRGTVGGKLVCRSHQYQESAILMGERFKHPLKPKCQATAAKGTPCPRPVFRNSKYYCWCHRTLGELPSPNLVYFVNRSKCKAVIYTSGEPCPRWASGDSDFCCRHRNYKARPRRKPRKPALPKQQDSPSMRRIARKPCGALTAAGTPCRLPVVMGDFGESNSSYAFDFERCSHHQRWKPKEGLRGTP